MPPVDQLLSRIQNTRKWDLAAAAPVILLCLLGALGFAIRIHGQWPSQNGFADEILITSEISGAIFLLCQAGLLCIRRLPVSKAHGFAPRFWALMGAYFTLLILLIPKVTPTPVFALISSVLTLAGTASSIATLIWLGRAFSILPQARTLVTAGPYRLLRHPLYLAEQVSAFGLALQFRQPWGLLIVLIGFAFQFPRMRYEEKVLEASFPAYRGYAVGRAKILPFLY
jgi:protein-S-isoprenylcysteine O-methyltransferase Ste14